MSPTVSSGLASALLLLLSAAPPLTSLEDDAKAARWDELYLKTAALEAAAFPPAERPRVAALLARGCAALLAEDAPLALGIGSKAVELGADAEGILCAAEAAMRLEQRGAALKTLREGARRWPQEARVQLALAQFLLDDQEPDEAAAAAGRVKRGTPQYAEAQRVLTAARTSSAEELRARSEARRQAEGVARRGAAKPEPRGRGEDGSTRGARASAEEPSSTSSATWESSVDSEGRRLRGNAHFRFRYFGGQRDFGQRAEYEGRVQAALEEARLASEEVLGVARKRPVDVVLYSRAEFELHHGPQAADSIAGFYSASAIRMNDSASITPAVQATLVHEYTHAVFDELSSFNSGALPTWLNEGLAEYTEWRSQGSDTGPYHHRALLKDRASSGTLPSVTELTTGGLIGRDSPGLLYALCANAVRLMVARIGVHGVVRLVRQVGAPGNRGFAAEFERAMGRSLQRFDTDLREDLAGR